MSSPVVTAEVAALVLTHRRPRLATDVVRGLIQLEGIDPKCVFLVVNGEGGLEDQALEESVHVLRLPENLGPAGGFRAGLLHIMGATSAPWIYVCEDDIGLFDLPTPRVRSVLEAVARRPDRDTVGAVVAYGRKLDRRTGFTSAYLPEETDSELESVDVAAWGATLLSRAVLDKGVLPDAALFFGFEDFDFWLQTKAAGFDVLVDTNSARAVTRRASGAGRDTSFSGQRPNDSHEPWRAYYLARNFFELRRRWGDPRWTVAHLVKSVRRFQLGPTAAHRRALLLGLWDGLLHRSGRRTGLQRRHGEF